MMEQGLLERLAWLQQPAYERLCEHVLSFDVIGANEIRWRLMGAPEGERSRWQVWALSRSTEAARAVLAATRAQ